MFSSAERLAQRTPKNGVDRFSFLKELVNELQSTKSIDAKKQVLANLANFAYDPINYDFLRVLSVINIFLDQLSEEDVTLTRFAIGGLCNLSLDPQNKHYIITNGGVKAVIGCLTSLDEETVLSAITTLMFLFNSESKKDITNESVVNCMLHFKNSPNKRLKNLATIFLEDFCKIKNKETALNV